jgi:hypothetical protein
MTFFRKKVKNPVFRGQKYKKMGEKTVFLYIPGVAGVTPGLVF